MNWLQFLSYAVVTAATPGPNNIMSMSNAGRLGFRCSFPFNLGIWAGFSLVMLLCTAFCGALSSLIPRIKTPMLFMGAAYMLWLAWKTFRSASAIEEDHRDPKIYIYGVVSLEAYILPYFQGRWAALALFALLLAFIGFVFTLLWALFGSVFKLLFSRYARVTNTVMALLLVYCAVSLFL